MGSLEAGSEMQISVEELLGNVPTQGGQMRQRRLGGQAKVLSFGSRPGEAL